MKKTITYILALIAVFLLVLQTKAQTNGDYRSINSGNLSDPLIWETYNAGWGPAATAPTGAGSITIMATHTVTVDANVTITTGKTFLISSGASIIFNATNFVNGTGTFSIANGSTFITASAGGVYSAIGSVRNTAGFTPNTTANYEFNGSVAQTANLNTLEVNNLTISNTSAGLFVTFGSTLYIYGTLNFTSTGKMRFTGNLYLDGGPIAGTASRLETSGASCIVNFRGSAAGCFLPSSIISLLGLTINKPANHVSLTNNLSLTNLSFSKGNLVTGSFFVFPSSPVTGASDSSYIQGKVRYTSTGTIQHVGTASGYMPISMFHFVTGGSLTMEVEAFNGTPAGTVDGTTLTGSLINRYWVLKAIGSGTLANLNSITLLPASGSPVYTPNSRIAVSTNNALLSYVSRGGNLVGSNLQSLFPLTPVQLTDVKSSDGLFISSATNTPAPLASGIYCVGPSASYSPPSGPAYINGSSPFPTLTAALNFISENGISGNTVLEIQNNYTDAAETYPLVLSHQGNSASQLEIRVREDFTGTHLFDAASTNDIITGGLFWLKGCKHVTINGTRQNTLGTQAIRIYNTSSGGRGFVFDRDAVSNTLTGIKIEATYGVIINAASGILTGADSATIQYCYLTRESTTQTLARGIEVIQTGPSSISDCKILNNYFENLYYPVRIIDFISGFWELKGNHFFISATNVNLDTGINLQFNANPGYAEIENNYFGGSLPFAAGTRMPVITAIGLTITNTTSTTKINGNVIKNIRPVGTSVSFVNATVYGNLQIDNNIMGDASLPNAIDFLSTENAVFVGITASVGSAPNCNLQINNNLISNLRFQSTINTGNHRMFFVSNNSSVGTVTINGNTVSQINIAGLSSFSGFALSSGSAGVTANVNNNVIESISRPLLGGGSQNFHGFNATNIAVVFNGNRIGKWNTPNDIVFGTPNQNYCYFAGTIGSYPITMINDTIANVNFTNTSATSINAGILINVGAASHNISNNVIKNLSSATTRVLGDANGIAGGFSLPLAGITYYAIGSNGQVNNNIIDGLNATSTAVTNVGVLGIAMEGGNATLTGNKIYNLTNSTTGTATQPFISGIRFFSNTTLTANNNMISINNGANTNAVRLYGLHCIGSSTYTANFNTITIGGSSAGNARSAAFWKTTLGNYNLRNNIFHNNRTGGTLNYAMVNENGTGTGSGWTYSSNYNNIYSTNPATTGAWPLATNKTFTLWQALSGDANSKNTDVRFVNATNDLHMAITTNCNLDNEGTNVAGINTDIDGQTRHATTPSIGADEYTYDPNWATVTSNSIVCSPPESLDFTTTDNTYGAHSYQWSGPNGFSSTAGPLSISNPTDALQTGTYTVTITDVLSCVATPVTTVATVYEPPVITFCPGNVTQNNDAGLCTAVTTYSVATASGVPTPVIYYSHPSGSAFPVGTTTVTVSAVNYCDSVTCTFDVIISDNELPVISNCPANISLNIDAGLCTAVATWTAPTATDNCAIQTFTSSHNGGDAFPVGTTTVTYTATDIHGNVQTCSFTVTVTDNELPVISNCPTNISVFNDAGLCSAVVTWIAPTAVDNCAIQTFTSTHNSGASFPVGTTTVIYTATDVNGNVQTCSFAITVTDNELPVISNCPANINVNNDATLCSAVVTWTTPTAADNCGLQTFTSTHNSGATFPVGTTTVTYTATDIHGNVQTCSFNVVVTDNELPVISNCPTNININNDAGLCNAVVTWTAPTATDNCGLQTFTSTHNSGATFPVGTSTVTYTATDIHGNVQTCSFTVTVTDNELPVISNCPANISLNIDAGLCTAVATWTAPTATDNCAIQTFTSSHNSGDAFPVGTTTVTYTATDIHGNMQTCSFTVTVTDNELPVISNCPTNISVFNDATLCTAVATWAAPTAQDNCALQTFTSTHNSGDAFPVGTTTVTYTATDLYGNVQTCSFNVVVTDNELPIISNCPTNININNDSGLCNAVVTWTAPTANDNCSIQTFIPTHTSGATFPVGTTTVTYSATDIHGNVQTCSFNVVVTDNELPIISNCPTNININNDAGLCNAVVTWTAPTAADNCGIQTFTSTHNSGATFPVGTSTVIYTAIDIHGNVQTCSFTVTVNDTQLPVINNCPANISRSTSAASCTRNIFWTAPTATDNCGIQSFTSTHISPSQFPVGVTTVTYTATDSHGNSQTCSFTVTITDSILPNITCPAPVTTCNPNASLGTPVVSDNCGVDTVYNDAPAVLSPGFNVVTWTVVDIYGNIKTCQQMVFYNTLTVNAGNDDEICSPNAAYLNATVSGSYITATWTSTGDGIFNNTSILNPVYTPGVNDKITGSVILTLNVNNGPGCNYSDSKMVVIRATLPVQPSVVSGAPLSVCPPLNGLTLSVTNDANVTSYTWANAPGSNGITFNPVSTTNMQIIDIATTTNSTYNIRVTATNACGSSLYRSVSIRRSVGTPSAITGSNIVCAGQSYVYTASSVGGAESYTWAAPAGSSINGGGNTLTTAAISVNIQMPAVFTTGTISVTANVACFVSAPRVLTVSSSTLALGVITGPASICPGTTHTFSVPAVAGAVSYQWTLPANATGTSTTNNINVAFNTGFTGANVCVKATSACGVQTASRCKSVAVTLPATPSSIAGITNGICGQIVSYNCPSVMGATGYVWTLPSGATGSSSSNSITVTFPSVGLTTAPLSVRSQNSCGVSLPRTITVKGAPNTPGIITANPSIWCSNDAGISLTGNLGNVTGIYNLVWSIIPSSAATIINGQGTNNLVVDWNSGNATILLTAINGCGSGTRTYTANVGCRELADVGLQFENDLIVYPNPAIDKINIELMVAAEEIVTISIADITGKQMALQNIKSIRGNNSLQLDVSNFAKGIYILNVKSDNLNKQVKVTLQ